MMNILKDLTSLNRVFCSTDFDASVEYLKEVLPFKEITITKSEELNGWVIPPKWDLLESHITQNGKLIYDGRHTQLATIALSTSYVGTVSLEELKNHLHYDHRYPNAIPYHFRQIYRTWDRTWGFGVTKEFYDSLLPGSYDVCIRAEESEGYLKLLSLWLPGNKGDSTFHFLGHLDHRGMANDGLSGCVSGIELFRRLQNKRPLKHNYHLLLVPEIMGSIFYLNRYPADSSDEGLFLESLGTNGPFAVQENRSGECFILEALESALEGFSYKRGEYSSIVNNDEYIWDNQGIPMPSFSRFPYKEYHTHWDNFSIMNEDSLNDAVGILENMIHYLDFTPRVRKLFKGEICTSNPKYNLYVDPGQPAFEEGFQNKELRRLMDLIPSLHKPKSINEICKKTGLSKTIAMNYLLKWRDFGLIEIT